MYSNFRILKTISNQNAVKKITVLFLLFFVFSSISQDYQPIPKEDWVVDKTNTLNSYEFSQLKQKLRSFESVKGSQVNVLIVPTVEPETIELYSIRVVESWKIGRKKVDDGVLLLIAKNDREVRIEVGYGLEGAIPDVYAHRIIENVIKPEFKNSNFYVGIDRGTDAIIKLIQEEELPGVTTKNKKERSSLFLLVFFCWPLVVLIGRLIKKRYIQIPLVASYLIAVFFITTLLPMTLFIGVFTITAIFGKPGSGRNGGFGGGRYYGGGSSWGGGSGGGFGGGGFSGGGGGFGGGGASGSW